MDPRAVIDAKGQLTAVEPSATARLAERAGTYALAATSPDWLLLVRTPTTGGVLPTRPRVVLSGDVGAFPVSDLIAFLGQSRWTGVLRLSSPGTERTLVLKDGEVRSSTSDSPGDRLGEIMVRLGHITRAQLEQVLADTPPSRIGKAMVERGHLQAHDLWKCLTEQVSEIFHGLMLAKEGVFVLVDQELDEKVHSLNLSMQSLLMDSIRKIDEMAHFRQRIAHGRLYVVRKRPSDGNLEPDEDLLLGLATGQRTVLELGQATRMTEFDATRVVYRLLEGGFVAVQPEPTRSAAPEPQATLPGADAEANVVALFNRIFREVNDEVAPQGKLPALLQAANAALSTGGLSSIPILFGMSFQPDCTLDAARVLAQYGAMKPQLGSEPLASLRQCLSDVMFFLLFQAGELLEQQADEALARRVKALLATLEAQ